MRVDIVVVGGGMVGAAFAAAMADSGLSIAVLDAQAPTQPNPEPPRGVRDVEPRVSALNLATRYFLGNIGAWEHLPVSRVCDYTAMEVWDAEGTGHIAFNAADTGTIALGYLVENSQVAAALYLACRAEKNIDWRAPVKVIGYVRDRDGWRVMLADGTEVAARLLVGADGALSQVRERMGVRLRQHDYRHHAIVGTVETEFGHDSHARQRFLDSGPLAFLPVADAGRRGKLSSIVWSIASDEAKRLVALDDTGFARELAGAFEERLGAVVAVGPRSVFPLIERHADDYVRDGAVLIGDAAHTVHPLAGQGVNLGFLDAATLAEEIGRNLARGLPFDDPLALRRYERRRKLHNVVMQKSFAGFKTLFETRALPVRWLRNTGMTLLDGMAPLKVLVARQAMGLDGDLPARCRAPVRGAQL